MFKVIKLHNKNSFFIDYCSIYRSKLAISINHSKAYYTLFQKGYYGTTHFFKFLIATSKLYP